MAGPAKPTVVPLAAITRVQQPANSGAARLVPPICWVAPFTITLAPEDGLASKATSATPRLAPDHRVCQLGFGSKVDCEPPVAPLPADRSFHTTSLFQVVVEASSLVPDTAITYCEAAGQLGTPPPVQHSSAPESPVEMEKVWAWAKLWSCVAAEPSPWASVSHSPSETLMIFVRLSVTTLLMSAVRLALDRVGML